MVKINSAGIVESIPYLSSSHWDDRPDSATIDMIVIHGISLPPGQFGTGAVAQFFCGNLDFSQHAYYQTIADMRVSAHFLIERQGQLTQFVPLTKKARHAGTSFFQGRENCNDFSIGIELEGTDDLPYEAAQYMELARLIKLLMHYYPAITRERIVGHADIAPGRKTDPGPFFDWAHLDKILKSNL